MDELLILLEKYNCDISSGKWNTKSLEEMEQDYAKVEDLRVSCIEELDNLSYSEIIQISRKIQFIREYVEARTIQSVVRRIDDLGRIVFPKKVRTILGNGTNQLDGKEFDIKVIYDEKQNRFGCEVFLKKDSTIHHLETTTSNESY